MIVSNFQSIFRPKHCVYIRAAVGLVGRDDAEALSRGSDEGSRKLAAECFLTTWLCPSSSKPDSTPCCLCLLLSSRSFPKKASWTKHYKTLVTSVLTVFKNICLAFLTSLGNTSPCHTKLFIAYWTPLENRPKCNRWGLKITVMMLLTSLLSAPTSPSHSYPQVSYYLQWHVTAAPRHL